MPALLFFPEVKLRVTSGHQVAFTREVTKSLKDTNSCKRIYSWQVLFNDSYSKTQYKRGRISKLIPV